MLDLDPVKSGPDALKSLADALNLALDAVYKFADRQKSAKDAKWALVREAATTAKTLVAEHVEAIRIVTAPARTNGDISSTAVLLRNYADTIEWRNAYNSIQGELEPLKEDKVVRDEAGPTIRVLRVELAKFEYVAFMIPYSSWRMADAIEWAAESARLLGDAEPHAGAAKARLDELHALLKDENAWSRFRTFPDEPEPDTVPAEPVTAEEMTLYVRDCMNSWFEHVQKTLYGKGGVTRLAANLQTISALHS